MDGGVHVGGAVLVLAKDKMSPSKTLQSASYRLT